MLLRLIVCIIVFGELVHSQAILYLGGVIRDEGPNYMTICGSAGFANGGQGFFGTDFELPTADYHNDEFGLVGNECNATNGWYNNCGRISTDGFRTPVYAYPGPSPWGNVRSPESFYHWFHDSNETIDITYNVPLQQIGNTNQYQYINDSFFPIDNMGWHDHCADGYGNQHNFAFCLEAHTRFGFTGNEVFTFSGDDDVWVFIDDRLVIDLGSLHPKRTKSLTVGNVAGLVPGQNYRFDFFYCERHTTNSDIEITTSLQFYCSYYDWCGVCEGTGLSCCNSSVIEMYCDDGNVCTTDTCSVLTSPILHGDAGCNHTQIPCQPANLCETAYCNKTTGCMKTRLTCNDGNPCTIDVCNNNTGCSNIDCDTSNCPPGFGCVPKNLTCDDHNPCTIDTINFVNGTAVNCSYAYNTSTCNDHSVCTNDACAYNGTNPNNYCSNTPITCVPPSICYTVVGCDRVNGCMYAPLQCPGSTDFCKISTCDPIAGCISENRVCVVSDPDCFKGVCNSANATCTQQQVSNFNTATHNGILCPLIYDSAAKGAAIGVGAAVGIAIGGAAAAGIFGYGGKKGYEYMKLMREQKFGGVQNNPLYEQTNANTDNPLYRYSTNPQ